MYVSSSGAGRGAGPRPLVPLAESVGKIMVCKGNWTTYNWCSIVPWDLFVFEPPFPDPLLVGPMPPRHDFATNIHAEDTSRLSLAGSFLDNDDLSAKVGLSYLLSPAA
jgi:hypothetical protein